MLLVVLFGLGGLATQAGSEAVLPAYVAGLVVAGVFLHDRVLMDRLRSIAFALLTPFFFLRAGTLISAPALITGAGVIAVLLLVKLALPGIGPVLAAVIVPEIGDIHRFSSPAKLCCWAGLTPRHPGQEHRQDRRGCAAVAQVVRAGWVGARRGRRAGGRCRCRRRGNLALASVGFRKALGGVRGRMINENQRKPTTHPDRSQFRHAGLPASRHGGDLQ